MKTLFISQLLLFAGLCLATEVRFPDYPYALLTDDYAILSKHDLATCDHYAPPKPFAIPSGYLYWQCFSAKDISYSCIETGYYEEYKSVMAAIDLVGNLRGKKHHYEPRHAIPKKDCLKIIKKFKSLMKNEKAVCLAGMVSSHHVEKDKEYTIWAYERFKTKRGCESWFEGECK